MPTAPPTLIATPRRIFTKLPGTHISICDYVFKDETAQDSIDRLQELFSLGLSEEDLELRVEHLPGKDSPTHPCVIVPQGSVLSPCCFPYATIYLVGLGKIPGYPGTRPVMY